MSGIRRRSGRKRGLGPASGFSGPASSPLDRLPRLRLGPFSAFHVCGVTGLAVAGAVAFPVVAARDGSAAVMAGVVALAVAAFLGLALATKVVTGEERLIAYHHQVVVPAVLAAALAAAGRPVLLYLDAAVLGIGAFLACGRVGCFMVGCCHGRPALGARPRLTVRYGEDHGREGLPRHLVGVRLLAVPLMEAAWVAAVVAGGVVLVAGGAGAGAGAAWYASGYALGRFFIEVLRGDEVRPAWGPLSEAQWTSLTVAAAVAALTGAPAAVSVAAVLVAAAVGLGRRGLAHGPAHVREVAEAIALARATAQRGVPGVGLTSGGVMVSALVERGEWTYAVSSKAVPSPAAASPDRVLAAGRLVAALAQCPDDYSVVMGAKGIVYAMRAGV